MSVNEAIEANRRMRRAAPDQSRGLETVSIDWAGAFYEAYSHLLPHMKTREEVEGHFVLWSGSRHFTPPSLYNYPRTFSQVLFALVHELQVCRVDRNGAMLWQYRE